MLIQPAEESFGNGLVALEEGRRREAMALFEAAIELERRLGAEVPQPRYLSYYGLCMGLELQQVHEALRFTREAVRREGYNPDVHCNLGRVLLIAGKRREAHDCFLRAMKLEPAHASSVRQLRLMGVRRRPIIPFLGRTHPLNVLIGRLRARRKARSVVAAPVRSRAAASPLAAARP